MQPANECEWIVPKQSPWLPRMARAAAAVLLLLQHTKIIVCFISVHLVGTQERAAPVGSGSNRGALAGPVRHRLHDGSRAPS